MVQAVLQEVLRSIILIEVAEIQEFITTQEVIATTEEAHVALQEATLIITELGNLQEVEVIHQTEVLLLLEKQLLHQEEVLLEATLTIEVLQTEAILHQEVREALHEVTQVIEVHLAETHQVEVLQEEVHVVQEADDNLKIQ